MSNKVCKPEDIALKSFFLGPQSENAAWLHETILHVFRRWYTWRKELHPEDGRAITEDNQLEDLFTERKDIFRDKVDDLLNRFEKEVPSFSPRYIGHMVTESSLPALIGHIITLLHNPNNISGEASRVGLAIEKEALDLLLKMVGYDVEKGFGHFTSGGTVANFEGAIRARSRMNRWIAVGAAAKEKGLFEGGLIEAAHMGWDVYEQLCKKLTEDELVPYHFLKSNPFDVATRIKEQFGVEWMGPVMLVPSNKHYSWVKAATFLGYGEEAFWSVPTDRDGRMCVNELEKLIQKAGNLNRPVMMVVSVAGTTELGEFDPVDKIQDVISKLRDKENVHIWHHVDAAYGGFFCTLKNFLPDLEEPILPYRVLDALKSIARTNSVTIDPHKLGYVPYASGTFLCADRREYFHSTIKAPYIAFQSELNYEPGPQTLEGSRSAAGPVSTWLTANVIGMDEHGYGRILERSVKSAGKLSHLLVHADNRIRVNPAGESNIVTFCVAEEGEALSVTNERSLKIYEAFSPQGNHNFVVSKTTLSWTDYEKLLTHYTNRWKAVRDTEELTLIRLVLMNPFFDTVETNISYPEEFVRQLCEVIEQHTLIEY